MVERSYVCPWISFLVLQCAYRSVSKWKEVSHAVSSRAHLLYSGKWPLLPCKHSQGLAPCSLHGKLASINRRTFELSKIPMGFQDMMTTPQKTSVVCCRCAVSFHTHSLHKSRFRTCRIRVTLLLLRACATGYCVKALLPDRTILYTLLDEESTHRIVLSDFRSGFWY